MCSILSPKVARRLAVFVGTALFSSTGFANTVNCDFFPQGLQATLMYVDYTFWDSVPVNDRYGMVVLNAGSYTVDEIRVIQNCGGVEKDVLRGVDLLLDQAAMFMLADKVGTTPCSYQLRGFIKGGSSKTWSLNASTTGFKFGGSLFKVTGSQYDFNHTCTTEDPV